MSLLQQNNQTSEEISTARGRKRGLDPADIFSLGPKKRPYVVIIAMNVHISDTIDIIALERILWFTTDVTLEEQFERFVEYKLSFEPVLP
jgi:hypothetical protein